MTTEKKIPKGCVCNLLSTATCARGSFRCDRRHKVTTADQDTLRAELDAARARARHALVAGAEALRRIAAATPIGHEDVTKGPSTYCWLCYAASLLMAEAATTPATPLEQELITLRAREAKLRAALEPFAAYMDARDAKPFNGLGDTIHAIHTGTEWAAELTLAHCQAARAALAEGED